MTTALIPLDTLGAEIKARIAAGDRAMDKAEQHYIAAGIQLAAAKARLEETREMKWSAFLSSHARIRRRRADDLIAIGDGRISLAEHREKNRERVAAHRERKKEDLALRNANPVPAITGGVADMYSDHEAQIERLNAEIESLKKKLAKAEEAIGQKESQRRAQENLAAIADRQAREAANRAMFAEADKERLADQVADLEEEITRLKEPGEDHEAGLRHAEEMLLNEYYGVAETWLQHLGLNEEHPAHPHRIEAHNAFVSEDIGFADILMMVQHEAFGRLNDYFSSSCTWNGIPKGEFNEPGWRSHARNLTAKTAKDIAA